jgi:hypothetical protein
MPRARFCIDCVRLRNEGHHPLAAYCFLLACTNDGAVALADAHFPHPWPLAVSTTLGGAAPSLPLPTRVLLWALGLRGAQIPASSVRGIVLDAGMAR